MKIATDGMLRYKRFSGALNRLVMLTLISSIFILTACFPVRPAVLSKEEGGELDSVLKNGVLVIATDMDYPPQSKLLADKDRSTKTRCDMTQYTANQLEGFDVDVAVEVARRLGVEPCFVGPTWSQIVSGGWGGRWDISVGSMVITPDRMKVLLFSQPYISGEAVAFVHKDNKTYHNLSDLSGTRIGVCAGCAYESYLRGTLQIPGEKIVNQIQNATIVGYDTDTSALADLAAGDGTRLNAVLTDPDTGAMAIQQGLPIRRLGDAVYHDYSGIAVDKKSLEDPVPLVQQISSIVQAMHKDGTLVKFSQKYYAGDFTSPAARFDLQSLGQYQVLKP